MPVCGTFRAIRRVLADARLCDMANNKQGDGKQGTLAGLWLDAAPKRARSSPTLTKPQVVAQVPIEAAKPGSASAPWSVRELVLGIRQRVEREYQDIWVEGEISNCRPAPSGHIYFTLKDGEAQLPVVLFRRQAQLLRFRP